MSQKPSNKPSRHDDEATLAQLGEQLAAHRVRLNRSQQKLAEEAGVSRSTITRLEAGESIQLSAFIRVLRELGLLDQLDPLLKTVGISPMQALKNQGKARKRASSPRKPSAKTKPDKPWNWGEDQ